MLAPPPREFYFHILSLTQALMKDRGLLIVLCSGLHFFSLKLFINIFFKKKKIPRAIFISEAYIFLNHNLSDI